MPYIDLEKMPQDLLKDVLRSYDSWTPEWDRSTLIQLMYSDDALSWLDVGVDASETELDFGFDNDVTDPVEAEAMELNNKLVRAKISTELAKAAKTRADAEHAAGQAEEARAKAKIATAYVAR